MDSQTLDLYIILSSFLMVMLCLVVILIIVAANRQRLKQMMKMAQLELSYTQELRKVETEVTDHLMEHVAQELHDNVGHTMTLMRLHIENRKLDQPGLEPVFAPIEQTLDEAMDKLRLLSRSLNTDYINNIGLDAAIQLEVSRLTDLRRFDVKFEKGSAEIVLDKNQELMVYRIFQELLHNIIKHSKAKVVRIRLFPVENTLLVINDNGQGFNVGEVVNSSRASGLRIIRKRAEFSGLQCLISSVQGGGSTFTLKVVH